MACVKLSALFSSRHPRICLLGDSVPSVDVFVTVCDEKLDVIRDTVMGALNIDYPAERFRVIVTDDGASTKLWAWVNELMADHPNLYYHARAQKGGWKAGNLNCAIKYTEGLPGGPAQCVAGLDADMIPMRRWLRSVTAHLMRNSKMGMVCPTQVRASIQTPILCVNNTHLTQEDVLQHSQRRSSVPSQHFRLVCQKTHLRSCRQWVELWLGMDHAPQDCRRYRRISRGYFDRGRI